MRPCQFPQQSHTVKLAAWILQVSGALVIPSVL
jgi:hypothetical protein